MESTPQYPPDFLNPQCPSRQLFGLLASKWSLLVLAAISRGINRNGMLLRELGDISQKMLTQTLRTLEDHQLLSRQVHDLQKQIVINARVMAEQFKARGIRVAYDGTDTHMVLIDVGKIKGDNGIPLSGDIAARVLDIAGVTANRNTIPGDKSPFRATGVRFGTTCLPRFTARTFSMSDG